jgi:thiol:disulfide interchange protein
VLSVNDSFHFSRCDAFCNSRLGQRPSAQDEDAVLEPVARKANLYPANADAQKEIENGLKQSVADKKRMMLLFGANWCYDCHVLDRALGKGTAGKLMKESFILVHVDIGEGDKNLDLVNKFKVILDKGMPVVVILSGDGNSL